MQEFVGFVAGRALLAVLAAESTTLVVKSNIRTDEQAQKLTSL